MLPPWRHGNPGPSPKVAKSSSSDPEDFLRQDSHAFGSLHVDKHKIQTHTHTHIYIYIIIKGSLGGETSVLRTFRMSGKELVKERVSKES